LNRLQDSLSGKTSGVKLNEAAIIGRMQEKKKGKRNVKRSRKAKRGRGKRRSGSSSGKSGKLLSPLPGKKERKEKKKNTMERKERRKKKKWSETRQFAFIVAGSQKVKLKFLQLRKREKKKRKKRLSERKFGKEKRHCVVCPPTAMTRKTLRSIMAIQH